MMMFGMLPFMLLPLILVLAGFSWFFRRRLHRPTDAGLAAGRSGEIRGPRPEVTDGVVFRLAKQRGGQITLSDVVIETGLGMKEAEEHMDSMVDGAHVSIEVDDRGRLVYLFPELSDESKGV